MSGPAIHFNIGVVAYRLGEYERAVGEFNEVARTASMAPLAHYNLGLVKLKRERSAAARAWFERAQEEATDVRLRELAGAQLDRLPPPVERSWVGYAAAGVGYDDNVALVSSGDVLGVSDKADEFAELVLAMSAYLDRAWRFDAGVFATQYEKLSEFDQLVAQGGVHYGFDVARWRNDAAIEFGHTRLDGSGFENRWVLALQGILDMQRDWTLRLRYRYSDLDGLNDFTGLDGTRHEMQARAQREWGRWHLGLQYAFESDAYRDESLSFQEHKVGVMTERELPRGWWVAVDAAQRFSDYELDSHDNEDRFEVGIAIKKQLSSLWRVSARYEYANNAADQPEFDYRRSRMWIGAEATL